MFFQNSVIKRYLALLDKEQVTKAWEVYKVYFLNKEIQDNIRSSKEEQFQEGFLRELFVKVFGYTLNPSPNFNLITEQKNESDAKKADGAILRDEKVIGVIELKDHKTTDLSHVERQAFGYKSQHKDTKYVVISNFEKLRFYIDNAVEHIEWNLFTLNEEDFRLLYFCLAWENISADKPLKAKLESVSNEDHITQKLYKDYSAFKREIFADILKNNPWKGEPESDSGTMDKAVESRHMPDETDKANISTQEEDEKRAHALLLFKKTQKLLDRLLFIFFAEDCGLLPPNSMVEILKQWEQLKEMDEYVPLYNRIKKYFGYLDTGWQGKKYEIFAYNGGLFKPDEVLDGIKISDEILAEFTRKLADYDYSTEVDVNILGHIFENSLNEIEEVTAQINNGETPTVSKRKRDGVFYTPQYITKYIVENTVGRLCAEKKAKMGIDEAEYFADKNRQMVTKKRLLDQLTRYREWLLGITICDPACGSGAFLNAALQFLMAEHKLLDEMEAKITGSTIAFQAVENSILENNLYGVDINEESVEIARLALWLRTAKPHRKLNSLNNNIKCGNSLISDPEIAGEKAFDWKKEFPQVFEKGGFDIVIGNPPYVKEYTNKAAFEGLHDNPCYQGKMDLWYFFGSLSIDITKEDGYIGIIAPSNWITNEGAGNFRNIIINKAQIIQYIDFGDYKVFEDAGIQTMIYIMSHSRKNEKYSIQYSKVVDKNVTSTDIIAFLARTEDEKFIYFNSELERSKTLNNYIKFTNTGVDDLLGKMLSHSHYYLQAKELGQGIVGAPDECFLLQQNELNQFTEKEKQYIKPYYTGLPDRYASKALDKYIIYLSAQNFDGQDINDFPNIRDHFEPYIQVLTEARIKYGTPNKPYYYLHRERLQSFFEKGEAKIISQGRCQFPRFYYTEDDYYASRALFVIKTNKFELKYLLAFLNSSICRFWLKNKGKMQGDCYQVDKEPLQNIPIPECADQQPFIELAERMLALNKDLQAKRARFLRRLQDNMQEVKVTGALDTFDSLDFAGFVAELKKQKIKLSLMQQDEWEEYFGQYKAALNEISAQISATDKEIDARVYALYGLTEEEIKTIEG